MSREISYAVAGAILGFLVAQFLSPGTILFLVVVGVVIRALFQFSILTAINRIIWGLDRH